jgi:HEAT repeat protein
MSIKTMHGNRNMLSSATISRKRFRDFLLLAVLLTSTATADDVKAPPKPDTPASAAASENNKQLDALIKTINGEIDPEDWQARADAIVDVGKLKTKSTTAISALIHQMAVNNKKVTVKPYTATISFYAQRSLEQIGSPAATLILKQGLTHKNVHVRKGSATLLGQLKYKPAIDALIGGLGDPNYGVGSAASSALKSIGKPALLPLIKIVKDRLALRVKQNANELVSPPPLPPEIKRRNYAIGVLGDLDDPLAIEPLLLAIETNDALLRRWAAYALPRLRSDACLLELSREETVQRLLKALKEDEQSVRSGIQSVLRNVSGKSVDLLIQALDAPDRRLRSSLFDVFAIRRNDARVVPHLIKRIDAKGEDKETLLQPAAVIERRIAINSLGQNLRHVEKAETVLPLLIGRLKDPSPQVRQQASSTIERAFERWPEHNSAVLPLIEALRVEQDGDAKTEFVRTLGWLKDKRAVQLLVAELAKEEQVKKKNSDYCAWICVSLGRLGDARALPALRQRLPLEESFVIEAVGTIGDADAMPAMLKQLKEGSKENKLAVIKALTAHPDARAIEGLLEALHEAIRRNIFAHHDAELIRHLADALAATSAPDAAQGLIKNTRWKLVLDERFGPVVKSFEQNIASDPRVSAISGFGKAAIPFAIRELQIVHGDPGDEGKSTPWSRQIAIYTLSRFATSRISLPIDRRDEIESLMIQELQAKEPGVQFYAAQALGYLSSKKSTDSLIRLLEIPFIVDAAQVKAQKIKPVHVEVRIAAMNSLVWIGVKPSGKDVSSLAKNIANHLSHPDPKVRQSAARLVNSAKHPQATSLLITALQDESVIVREACAEHLGSRQDDRAIAALRNVLKTEPNRPKAKRDKQILVFPFQHDQGLRSRVIGKAARSLGALNATIAIEDMLQLAQHSDQTIRVNAIVGLAQLHDPRGAKAFQAAMQTEIEKVRIAIMQEASTLGFYAVVGRDTKISYPASRKVLCDRAVNDQSARVRSYAVSALRGITDTDTVAALRVACEDKVESIRCNALRQLMTTDSLERAKILKSFVTNHSPRCRTTAAYLYAQVFDDKKIPKGKELPTAKQAIEIVARLLDDPADNVRKSALDSFARLAKHDIKSARVHVKTILRLARSDVSASIRFEAQHTLKRIKQIK